MDGIGRICRETFLTVLDAGAQLAGDVLVECAAKTDIQALAAVANGEYWFPGDEGVLEDCEIGFFPVRVGFVRLRVTRGAIERRIHIGGSAGEDKSVQVFDLGGELVWGKLERQRDGFALCGSDGGGVILELVRDLVGFLVGGSPGDAHTWAGGGAQLGVSRGHGAPNRSIRKGGGQPAREVTRDSRPDMVGTGRSSLPMVQTGSELAGNARRSRDRDPTSGNLVNHNQGPPPCFL